MKKSGLIFLVIVSIILVSGQGCERVEKRAEGVFIGGKDGLVAEFVEDAPSVSGNFKGESFPVEVRLTNKGENDIGVGAVNIYLTGGLYARTSTGGDIGIVPGRDEARANTVVILAIEEGAEGLIEDSEVVDIGDVTYNGEIYGDNVPLDVSLAICYPYRTRVQVNDFCVPSTGAAKTGDECSIDSSVNLIDDGDNSGAPVQITSLREDKGSGYVRITLDINNVGNGEVVDTSCTKTITRDTKNKATVTMPSGFDCGWGEGQTSGVVELRNGHATLRCRKDVTNAGNAYKEPMLIKLDYNYWQDLSETITINRVE